MTSSGWANMRNIVVSVSILLFAIYGVSSAIEDDAFEVKTEGSYAIDANHLSMIFQLIPVIS